MSDVRDFFISRFNNGVIMEADFSQLEVIYLAHITKDPQLTKDILSGMDMHTVRAAELFTCKESEVTKEQRKTAKAFSFMLQYGAGAKHMSHETGHSIELAKKFIKNYYSRYPEVKKWQDKNIELVKKSAVKTTEKSPLGFPIKIGTLKSETGRLYKFKEGDAPPWMREKGVNTSFKPTEIKNYPIQGGATGDIVPMVVGKINRWLIENNYQDKAKLIATVHDSVVLDIQEEMVYTIGNGVKNIMETAPWFYEQIFGIKFDLPLKVEVKYGPSWGQCDTIL